MTQTKNISKAVNNLRVNFDKNCKKFKIEDSESNPDSPEFMTRSDCGLEYRKRRSETVYHKKPLFPENINFEDIKTEFQLIPEEKEDSSPEKESSTSPSPLRRNGSRKISPGDPPSFKIRVFDSKDDIGIKTNT